MPRTCRVSQGHLTNMQFANSSFSTLAVYDEVLYVLRPENTWRQISVLCSACPS